MNELSIIIPTLNEEVNLRRLLASIALQKKVEFEVIIADGGSSDRTLTLCADAEFRTLALNSIRGRATQLNAGAVAACGEFLLFLHADSELHDSLALRTALNALRHASSENSGKPYAGHFAIRYENQTGSSSRAFRLLECKARLNRKGCSHGDQGIMIPAGLFRKYGGFNESCQILAETRFADTLRENGQWLLLPAELTTSPRRFEKEGLTERQTMNAVIMALGAVGQEDMMDFSAVYAANDSSAKFHLKSNLRNIREKIMSLSKIERADFWGGIGGYICENAWQIAFRADLLLYCGNVDAKKDHYRFLELYDRHMKRLVTSRVAIRLTAYVSRLWLKYMTRG